MNKIRRIREALLKLTAFNKTAEFSVKNGRVLFTIDNNPVRRSVWSFLHRMELVEVYKARQKYRVRASVAGIATATGMYTGVEPGFVHQLLNEKGSTDQTQQKRAGQLLEMAYSDRETAAEIDGLDQELDKITAPSLRAWDIVRLCPAAGFDPQYVVCGVTPQRYPELCAKYRPPPYRQWLRETRHRVRDALTTMWVRWNLDWPIGRTESTIRGLTTPVLTDLWAGAVDVPLKTLTSLCLAGRFDAAYLLTGMRLNAPKKLL